MELTRPLTQMDAAELRALSATLLEKLAERDSQIAHRDVQLKSKQLKIDQLTHEMAILKRWKFDRRSEQMDVVQRSLLDESIDADLEAISLEIEALKERKRVAKTVLTIPLPDAVDCRPVCAGVPTRAERVAPY
jgi:hypothetical protein